MAPPRKGFGLDLLPEQTAPPTPISGYLAVYAKTDGKRYAKNDAGTEYDLTATGAGGGGSSYSQDIGNGVDRVIVVTHNLNTRDVDVTVRRATSPYDERFVTNEATSVNTVTLRFDDDEPVPATGAWRVKVSA